MLNEFEVYLLNKFQEWGLLLMSVVASSSALSMGLGLSVLIRRMIFSCSTSVIIASACYYGLKWEFTLSCASGYFACFLVESAFRQRLDSLGRALADRATGLIKVLPGRKPDGGQDD